MSISSELKKIKKIIRTVDQKANPAVTHIVSIHNGESEELAKKRYETKHGQTIHSGDLVVLLTDWRNPELDTNGH